MIAGPMTEMLGVAAWFAISGALIAAAGIGAYLMPAVQKLDEIAHQQHSSDETQA
jgi:hypothetical protein